MTSLALELPPSLVEALAAAVAERLQAERRGWLSIRTAATYLDTSEQALRALVKRDAIPVHRINGRVLFSPAELDAWVVGSP